MTFDHSTRADPWAAGPQELWLFTQSYPFGGTESFLENELPTLAQRFGKVRVFPLFTADTERQLPRGAEREVIIENPFEGGGAFMLIRRARFVLRLLNSLRHDLGLSMLSRAWRGELRGRIRQIIHRTTVMERVLIPQHDPARVVIYSYWTHDWATQLALLRTRHPEIRFVSRAHGFDLYEHQHQRGAIPFRRMQLQAVDKLFCVSKAGYDHMRSHHPAFAHKYEIARLGTRDHGLSSPSTDGVLRVVSCGYVIPRKRIWMIADALALYAGPVHWTHFGDGPEMEALRTRTGQLPAHVRVDLRGDTANAEIMAWYASHAVDVHVLTSALEGGVAVALQEAASFGVPLIATDSGGVRDLVTSQTGILLPVDASADQLRAAFEQVQGGPLGDAQFRAGVRAFWEARFNASVAFGNFCDRLLLWHEAVRADQRLGAGGMQDRRDTAGPRAGADSAA